MYSHGAREKAQERKREDSKCRSPPITAKWTPRMCSQRYCEVIDYGQYLALYDFHVQSLRTTTLRGDHVLAQRVYSSTVR